MLVECILLRQAWPAELIVQRSRPLHVRFTPESGHPIRTLMSNAQKRLSVTAITAAASPVH